MKTTTVKRWPDGSYAKVHDDGSWALKLASNKKLLGRENDASEALAMVENLHQEFVNECWSKGVLKANGRMEVKLR